MTKQYSQNLTFRISFNRFTL